MSIDLLVHAICVSIFKGKSVIVFEWLLAVHMAVCEMAIFLQSKSTKLFRDFSNWTKPKSYNRPYLLITFPRFWL